MPFLNKLFFFLNIGENKEVSKIVKVYKNYNQLMTNKNNKILH